MKEQMDELKEAVLITLFPPQPSDAFENENTAFMLTRFGIILELIDTEEKANLIKS